MFPWLSYFHSQKQDVPAKSRQMLEHVIPAKAGIQSFHIVRKGVDLFFKGTTTFCRDIKQGG
jgi:hypothetical protein